MVSTLVVLLPILIGLVESQFLPLPQENPGLIPSLTQPVLQPPSLPLNPSNQNPPQENIPPVSPTNPPLPPGFPLLPNPSPEQQKPNRGFVAIRDTVFRLFTRTNGRTGEVIKLGDRESIKRSSFNPTVPTRFFIHDWMNEGLASPSTSIRDAYLEVGHYNVFIVDWDAGSIGPYFQVRDTAPSVGRALAEFIDFMITEGQLDINQVYVVGYGLGAHIAGVAGKNLKKGRLPVIYALDPIHLRLRDSPTFANVLTHADADYVEVIHTSVLTTRLMRPVGHADFYVNYGAHQPGCGINPVPCSHERAYKYFAESIRTQQGFFGTPCNDFRDIIWRRSCRRGAGPMVRMGGEFAQNTRWGIYVVNVNSQPPFARGMME